MKKIGVIADTHGMLRAEVKEYLKDCDVILHLGDINKPEMLDELREIAPVRAVCGNADEAWAEAEGLPHAASLDLFGLRIYMIHNKKQIEDDISDRTLILIAHTHKYEERMADGQFWLNPGTCGPRRRNQPITMAVIATEEDGTFQVEKYEIPHPAEKKEGQEEKSSSKTEKKQSSRSSRKKDPAVTEELVAHVIRDVNAGTPADEIAEQNGISKELATQIRRIYIDHQGIDVKGVLEKLPK